MKNLILILLILLGLPQICFSQYWPLSRSSGENGDVITSPFGPRNNGGTYQIHYGLDLSAPVTGTPFYSIDGGEVWRMGGNPNATTGWFLTIRHNDGSYVRYLHLNEDPDDFWDVGDNVGATEFLWFTGNTGGVPAHLHVDYFPFNYVPSQREDAYNPLDILPHNTTADFTITNLAYVFGGGAGGEDQLRFDVTVHPQRLDVNRIELDIFFTYDIQCNALSEREILDTQEGFVLPPGGDFVTYQTPGRIDFEERSGFDYGPRGSNGRPNNGNFNEWNGVKIEPAEYTNSNQVTWHQYTISHNLDDQVLRTIVGGIEDIVIRVENSAFDGDQINTYSPVFWEEEWPYNMATTCFPNEIRIGFGGKILVLNQNSSQGTHAMLNFSNMIVEDQGVFQLEDGPNSNNRTWFENESSGNITIESGGLFILGNNARFLNYGYFECQVGANYVPGTAAEFDNYGFLVDNCGINLNQPGTCIIVSNGGELRLGTSTTMTLTNGGFLTTNGTPGKIVLEDDAQIIADGSSDSHVQIDVENFAIDLDENSKIKIESGSELLLSPGSTLKFGQDAKIEMYGKMLAQGTAGSPITFQSSYANPTTAQYWDGIYLNDGNADDNSIIEHAVIEYGQYGILAYNASPEIRNTTIHDCNLYALRLDYSTAEITNNTLENSAALAGVYMRYSDPLFTGNTIRNNNTKGLYLYQSNPDMTFNTFSQNDYYGMFCTYYSSPEMGSSMEPMNPGINTIEGHDVGIYANNYSQPFWVTTKPCRLTPGITG